MSDIYQEGWAERAAHRMRVRAKLVSPPDPEKPAVSLAEEKLHGRITQGYEDTKLQLMLSAALNALEEMLGKKLITQSWKFTYDAFPSGGAALVLPFGRAQEITSITYIDDAGATQTLATTEYELDGDDDYRLPQVSRAYGKSWPSTRCHIRTVAVTAVLGFGEDSTYVPEELRLLAMSLATFLYDNPEAFQFTPNGGELVQTPVYFDMLISKWAYPAFA
jgi:uncharacterized phiE125 gp8 family phage protein